MGAYNTLEINSKDGKGERIILQFKYGDTWQNHYKIGDAVKWGGNDLGSPQSGKIVVDAIVENFDEEIDYYILICDNIIIGAHQHNGIYNFGIVDDYFIKISD